MSGEGAGEFILNSVDNDGMMNGFDLKLINYVEKLTNLPIVCVGGGGDISHYVDLFSNTNCDSVGSSSIFLLDSSSFSPVKGNSELRIS
jgi:cyclase